MKRWLEILLPLILVVMLTACGNNQDSVVGTWYISEYRSNGTIIQTDDIDELMGENAGEFNKYSLIFTSSGNVTLIRPDYKGGTNQSKLAYTVQDGMIEIYNPNDTSDYELYTYTDGMIYIDISDGLSAVFKKK